MALVAGYDEGRLDEWRQTRILSYVMMCTVTKKEERPSIYEFMPLKGDPKTEDLQNQKAKDVEGLLKLQKELTQQVRDEMLRIKKRNARN